MSRAVAPAMPNKIARVRCCSGNPAAAMPTTTALSPARAKSIITTWNSAAIASGVNNSIIRWLSVVTDFNHPHLLELRRAQTSPGFTSGTGVSLRLLDRAARPLITFVIRE